MEAAEQDTETSERISRRLRIAMERGLQKAAKAGASDGLRHVVSHDRLWQKYRWMQGRCNDCAEPLFMDALHSTFKIFLETTSVKPGLGVNICLTDL